MVKGHTQKNSNSTCLFFAEGGHIKWAILKLCQHRGRGRPFKSYHIHRAMVGTLVLGERGCHGNTGERERERERGEAGLDPTYTDSHVSGLSPPLDDTLPGDEGDLESVLAVTTTRHAYSFIAQYLHAKKKKKNHNPSPFLITQPPQSLPSSLPPPLPQQ